MARTAEKTTTPSVDVLDLSGSKVGTVELPAEWFTGEVKTGVMHQVVTAQLARARQGTAKTKTRGERRGGGRKPWRQKGTGRARHGSIRSPMWKKGGVAHGRTGQENFVKRVNKSMKRTALRSALTDRVNGGNVVVVRDLAFYAPRTKDAVAAIDAIGQTGRKVLVVLGDLHQPTWKSFRNLPEVHALTVDQLNTYDVLVSDVVVFDESAVELIGTGRRAEPREVSPPAETEAAEPDDDASDADAPAGVSAETAEPTEAEAEADEVEVEAETGTDEAEAGTSADDDADAAAEDDETDDDEKVE